MIEKETRLKFICKFGYGDAPPKENQGIEKVPVFGSNGQFSFASDSNTKAPVIVIGRKGSYGKINWSKIETFASDTTFFVDSSLTSQNLRWLYWALQILKLDEGTNEAAVPGLNRETAYQKRVFVPLIEQQILIADYLDRETTEIDNLIAEKEKMLTLLEEKREALISHAVSSKENENQGNCCLKFLTSKVGSGKTPRGGSEIYSKSGVMLIRSQNVHFAGLRLDDVVFISGEIDEDMKNTRVKSGDVLLNITGASLGRCTVVTPDFPPANVNQHVSIIRCIDKMLIPQYLCYTLQGAEIRNKIWAYENGSSREGLNFEQIASFSIRVISLEQQQKIIDYLDKETTKTDGLLGAIRESIALLKERRSALITAAVTGQISIEEMTT